MSFSNFISPNSTSPDQIAHAKPLPIARTKTRASKIVDRTRNLALITPTEVHEQLTPGKIAAHSKTKCADVMKNVAENKMRLDVRGANAASGMRKLLGEPLLHAAIATKQERSQSVKVKIINTPTFAGI